MLQNDPQHVKLRRCQDTLNVVGTGIILLSAWSVVKLFGSVWLKWDFFSELRDSYLAGDDALSGTQFYLVLFFVMLLFAGVIVGVRVYVGLSAKAISRGKKASVLFLLFTFTMIAVSCISIISILAGTGENADIDIQDKIVSLIIELTSIIMLLEMTESAVRVWKLTGSGEHSIHLKG